MTPPSASDPSTRPSNRLAVPRQAELRGSPAAICPTISPSATACEPSTSPWRSCHDPHPPKYGGVRHCSHHPRFSSLAYPAPTHPFGGFGFRYEVGTGSPILGVGVGSPGLRVGVDLVVVVALFDSLLCLPFRTWRTTRLRRVTPTICAFHLGFSLGRREIPSFLCLN